MVPAELFERSSLQSHKLELMMMNKNLGACSEEVENRLSPGIDGIPAEFVKAT